MSKRLTTGKSQAIATPDSAWRKRKDAWEHLGYVISEISSEFNDEDRRGDYEEEAGRLLAQLAAIEPFWANPGLNYFKEVERQMSAEHYDEAMRLVYRANQSFRTQTQYFEPEGRDVSDHVGQDSGLDTVSYSPNGSVIPQVEILLVDNGPAEEIERFKEEILEQRQRTDPFHYNFVAVPSIEDALAAIIINPGIQSVVLSARYDIKTRRRLSAPLHQFITSRMGDCFEKCTQVQGLLAMERILNDLRPEIPVYLIAGVALESIAHEITGRFRRIFSRNDRMDLHLSILAEITDRYHTPFFLALQKYAKRPGGVFHAMPISRAGSVQNSPWAKDLVDFYGKNLLLAETSATSGGLDSLLDPKSSIKKAHELAARAFQSHRTYFVTNGTSTANKIVHQSILAPGDIVLVDRNCHKSHHYSLVLAGASVSYLEAYPLNEYSMYGAVPLEEIKGRLLQLRREGLLHKVKMLTLTNCTFDGIIYDPRRVMEECLAIKPDLVFLWDEAWFAFASFHPVYRQRTGMYAAAKMEAELGTEEYQQRYAQQKNSLPAPGTLEAPENDEAWLKARLIPDPATTRLRVYSTQSTHKTLTSLRQGSMIHVFDQDFALRNHNAFREAYMTHTSTSPNYQILASLDIGRRQAELEGYALVQRQVDLAQSIARAMIRNKLLNKYFRILNSDDLIPQEFRKSSSANPVRDGLSTWDEAWQEDELVVDPSRLTLDISRTGVDGDTFKHTYLMDGHSIQVNKTSRTSVLLMTNIGTNRSAVAHLIEVLVKIAEELEKKRRIEGSCSVRPVGSGRIPLPDFSYFADEFATGGGSGDMRKAYYLTYQDPATEFLTSSQIRERIVAGGRVVSAVFVTPYPPGFPVLVPGQVVTLDIMNYMDVLDTREIHGYHPEKGYQVFTTSAMKSVAAE